jgi:hypothetical protein
MIAGLLKAMLSRLVLMRLRRCTNCKEVKELRESLYGIIDAAHPGNITFYNTEQTAPIVLMADIDEPDERGQVH